MNWEPQNETLNVLQSYLGSALVGMLNIHFLIIFLKWLVKGKDWANLRDETSNHEFIPEH
jgi:hypothetical protein